MAMHRMETVGAELTPAGRMPTTVAGDPVQALTVLYEDERVEIGVWKCTPGSFTTFWDGRMESIQVLAGDGTLTEEDGTRHELTPGAFIVMEAGARGTWEIRETLMKSYTIVHGASASGA
jgi:uncharacterized protein